jgi:L-alanine-DL-glutamate epimerase-like enolase superfamily enzyme
MDVIDKREKGKTTQPIQPASRLTSTQAGASRIDRIEVERYRLPLNPPFPPAWDSRPRSHFDAVIVRVHTADGAVGIGAGTGMEGFEDYRELFIGENPLDIDRHHAVLSNIDFHAGRPWPLELALWDLAGKIKGQPVWRMLGGESGTVPCYASTGVLRDSGAQTDKVCELRDKGFPAVKIRFHRADWKEDVRMLEEVRRAVGDKVEIMVDCNQGWRMPWDTESCWTYHQALVVARELERLGVYWMEEPLHRCDWRGMSVLHNAVSVRIAGGEMTREPSMLEDLIERRCVDILQPDASLTCGITGAARLARTAAEAGVSFSPHTWGSGIGLLANAHLFAGCRGGPWLEYPIDPPEWTPKRRDFMLAEPIKADKKGCITLSEAPGLGIELDEGRLEKLRVG